MRAVTRCAGVRSASRVLCVSWHNSWRASDVEDIARTSGSGPGGRAQRIVREEDRAGSLAESALSLFLASARGSHETSG